MKCQRNQWRNESGWKLAKIFINGRNSWRQCEAKKKREEKAKRLSAKKRRGEIETCGRKKKKMKRKPKKYEAKTYVAVWHVKAAKWRRRNISVEENYVKWLKKPLSMANVNV